MSDGPILMYLLDTNVISALRKGKKADPKVITCAQTIPAARLYISAVSILEWQIGILLVERRDRKQGEVLRAWMDGHVLPMFLGRILAIDVAVAQRCALPLLPDCRSDHDALVAATAPVPGMTVVTGARFSDHWRSRARPLGILRRQSKDCAWSGLY